MSSMGTCPPCIIPSENVLDPPKSPSPLELPLPGMVQLAPSKFPGSKLRTLGLKIAEPWSLFPEKAENKLNPGMG